VGFGQSLKLRAAFFSQPQMYKPDHERKPDRVIVATESFPAESFSYWDGGFASAAGLV
jgi:hypothetical protein